MTRIIWNAREVTVRAACGHEAHAYVPPSGGRPGPVGKRNIAAAQAKPCFECRQGLESVVEFSRR